MDSLNKSELTYSSTLTKGSKPKRASVIWILFMIALSMFVSFSVSKRANYDAENATSFIAPISTHNSSVRLMARYTESDTEPHARNARPSRSFEYEAEHVFPQKDYQWVEVAFENIEGYDYPGYLHLDYPNLGTVKIYQLIDGGYREVSVWGDGNPSSASTSYSRTAAYRVTLEPNRPLHFGLSIHSPERGYYSVFLTDQKHFKDKSSFLTLSYALFSGIHFVMLVSLLFFATYIWVNKTEIKIDYLIYYAMYLVGSYFYMSNFDGSLSAIIPQNSFNYRFRHIIGLAGLIAYVQFILVYLNVYEKLTIGKCLRFTRYVFVCYIAIAFFAPSNILYYGSVGLFTWITFLAAATVISMHIRGESKAQYLLVAWVNKAVVIAWLVPQWLLTLETFSITEFQYTVRIAWMIEFLAIAAAVCMKLKEDYEGKKSKIDQEKKGEAIAAEKRALVRGVVHDIKNPLSSIYGATDQLLASKGTLYSRNRIELIRSLSYDVLNRVLVSFENAKQEVCGEKKGLINLSRFTLLDLTKKIYDTVETQRAEANKVSISFEINPAAENFIIEGDETRTSLIIKNILLQSLFQEDTTQIKVRLDLLNNKDQPMILASLDDDSDHACDLKDKFDKTPIEIAREELSIIYGYDVMDNVGASLVHIPCRTVLVPRNPRNKEEFLNMLFVDDQEENLLLVSDAVRDKHINMDFAPSVVKATSRIESKEYDCIIVDGKLSDGTAYDLIEVIASSENNSKAYIICYSADETEDFKQSIKLAGASLFVGKSQGISYLVKAVSLINDVEENPA